MSILSESEDDLVNEMSGCGCCSSSVGIDDVFPDECPVEHGVVMHSYLAGCNQAMRLGDVVEALMQRRRDAFLTLADDLVNEMVANVPLGRGDADWDPNDEFGRCAADRARRAKHWRARVDDELLGGGR